MALLASCAQLGRVAERQTRTVQVRVSVRTWGFKSPLAHPNPTQPNPTQLPNQPTPTTNLGGCRTAGAKLLLPASS